MSENNSDGNPMFDLWMNSQRSFFKNQDDWLSPWNMMENTDTGSFAEQSKKNWQQCEEQFNNWVKTSSNLFSTPSSANSSSETHGNYSTEALHQMLNPESFMNSGFFNTSQIFQGMLNGPEFSDFGVMEKKLLKNGRDWLALNEATDEYQKVIALAWSRAFQEYSDEFVEYSANEDIDTQYLLELWLKIADKELVGTLRSEDFLEAQRNLFSAATAYKLKQREFAEMWCESQTIPTRSEVDDLHKMVHELRREVRQLKRQAAKTNPAAAPTTAEKTRTAKPIKPKAATAQTTATPPPANKKTTSRATSKPNSTQTSVKKPVRKSTTSNKGASA